jgi:hypothetical protein
MLTHLQFVLSQAHKTDFMKLFSSFSTQRLCKSFTCLIAKAICMIGNLSSSEVIDLAFVGQCEILRLYSQVFLGL